VLTGELEAIITRRWEARRSAGRNLPRAGIGPEVGMKITGQETPSMRRRYSIVDENDIEQALQVTQAYIAQARKKDGRIALLSEARQ
jgi:hypothetical protein